MIARRLFFWGKKNFFFSFFFVLAYSYLWLRRRYLRSTIKTKTTFCFVLFSLIRTFAPKIEK